jgi:RimJ/RimL family protein N-acetyltransferase
MSRQHQSLSAVDDGGTLEPVRLHQDEGTLISARARGSRRQTFLVGPTIYLRPIELVDAHLSAFWKESPFPVPADMLEEKMKESVPGSAASGSKLLIACRRTDNMPIGSIEVSTEDGRLTQLRPHVPIVFGQERASELTAEMLRLMVPWLIHEHDNMTVTALLPSDDPIINKAARVAGMRLAYRLREALIAPGGGRIDQECWQALHPTWLARLGKPPEAVQGNVVSTVRSPARRTYRGRTAEPPRNALMVGDRIYLRAIEQADAEEIARWSMRETDIQFDTGRQFRSPISYWHWNRKTAEVEPPTWTRFAICLLSDHTVIGANGLAFIDWIHRTAETETEIVRPEYRGGGYGTEAKHLLLEFAFDLLGLHMVRSMAWAFNTRSCEALRKQGYRDAGRLAWTGIKSGDFADDLVFDLLASEWRAARI